MQLYEFKETQERVILIGVQTGVNWMNLHRQPEQKRLQK